MTDRNVDIHDIPIAVLEKVENGLRNYFVPILAFWRRRQPPKLKLLGSGTLIKKDRNAFILTAAHVWNEAQDADIIYLFMMRGRAVVAIPYANISPKVIWDSKNPEEWGPDLAWLEIPPPQLATINAYKSFLDFDHQLGDVSKNPPKTEKSLWAVYGVPGEFSALSVVENRKELNMSLVVRAFFGGIVETHTRSQYDYYDTSVDLWLPGVPKSFGGVSGGGLWQVNLSISKSGEFSWDEQRHFRGVAFWQSQATDERRIVRCHGPLSIFERVWHGIR